MRPDVLLPVITGLGWLLLVGSALVSLRLGWTRLARLALVWLAIFAGLTLLIAWFLASQGTGT